MTITIDGTTGIASVDGSAGSPSVRGSDANSGIVYSADTVAISTGGTERLEVDSSGNIDIPDNGKIRFGGSADLSIYHTGSNARIDNGTGDLYINAASGETGVGVYANAQVELYYNNAKVFETLEYGARVKRPSGGSTDFEIIGCEGQEAMLHMYADDGDDNDDKFRLRAGTDNFYIENYADGAWETNIECEGGDGVKLYQNNSLRCQVIGNGFKIEANHHLELPSGNWTGEHSGKIQSHGGGIYFQAGSNSGYWDFRLPSGNNVANISSAGAYTQTSDRRLKKDIATIPNAVDTIKQLTGRSFTWINGDKKSFGIIAQEIQSVLPDVVHTPFDPANKYPDDPIRSVNYAALTGHLVEAIKELSAKIETLETKVAALEAK